MRLYEFEGAEIFRRHGIPTTQFGVAHTPEEARDIAAKIGKPVVIKAQVLVGGRGKAGGIKKASNPVEAALAASELLGKEIRGEKVRAVMVTEAVDISREFYLSLTLDRYKGLHVLLASPEGGMDIEEIAAKRPERLARIEIDPLIGIRDYHARRAASIFNLDSNISEAISSIIKKLYSIYITYECELAEINPLALTSHGDLKALDAKLLIDDNAVKRLKLDLRREGHEGLEEEARTMGFSYVELDGEIGVIGNGAGLTMATMDLVEHYGGKPANFLDIGGGASEEVVYKAASLLLRNQSVKVLFINVLGGITRCDEVARGLVRAMREYGKGRKLVVRLVGTREEEGQRILKENGYEYLESMEEAAKKAVELAGG